MRILLLAGLDIFRSWGVGDGNEYCGYGCGCGIPWRCSGGMGFTLSEESVIFNDII